MDKKSIENANMIEPVSNKLKKEVVPYLPPQVTTYNLTMASTVWSSVIIYAGYKAKKTIKWLYVVIICIIFHWITDTLDGAVGRYRNTGAVKWGYFMDHAMDVLLLTSICISLFLCLPKHRLELLLLYQITIFSMVISFLSLDNRGMDVSYCVKKNVCLGPADGLILIVVLIGYVIYSNGNPNKNIMRIAFGILLFSNIVKIYKKQKHLHDEDMRLKHDTSKTIS